LVGHLPQLGVGLRADQLLDLGDLAERRLVGAVPVHHGRQLLGLAGQALVRGLVLGDGRVRHLVLDLAVTRFYVFEFLERYGIHWNPRGDCRLPKKTSGGPAAPPNPPPAALPLGCRFLLLSVLARVAPDPAGRVDELLLSREPRMAVW